MTDSYRAVLQSFPAPSYPTVAAGLGVRESRVAQWASRDFVPSEYWLGLVALARTHGVRGVTLERLARFAAAKRGAPAGGLSAVPANA
ncbi:MAG: hypothetical protein NBV67_00285 [Tagaea sp.]|nr:hypothetical protein [Tagaea sp.]